MPQPRHFTDPNWPKNMTSKHNLRFWLAYEKQSVLWDFRHKAYSSKHARQLGFQVIADEMQIPGLDAENVKLKIRFLRTQYTRWIKRLCLLQETGEPFPKIPTWFHVADKFLRDQIRLRKPNNLTETHSLPGRKLSQHSDAEVYFGPDMPVRETIEVGHSDAHEVEGEEEEEEEEEDRGTRHINVKTEVVDDNSQFPDNSIYLELDDEQLMAIENGEMSIEDVTARAEAAASQHQQHMVRGAPRPVSALSQTSSSGTVGAAPVAARENRETARIEVEEDASRGGDESDEAEDEFDAFGRCVALQLKTLPIDSALELESQIHALITKKRMVLLRKNSKH